MWRLVLILAFKNVICDELFSAFTVHDQCINICKESTLPKLDLENYEQVVCQRGCRFFNIILFKDEPNLNITLKECHSSCNDSYVMVKENDICLEGCNLMAKKHQSEVSTVLVFTEEEDSSNIVLAEPDLDILESDLLSDPSIKSQLEIGFNIDYKIPETHIRTMPIKFKDETIIIKSNEYPSDWIDCASRNSGIPRWILLTAILSAVLVALWLSFSTEKRSNEEIADVNISDEKLLIEKDLFAPIQEVKFANSTSCTVEIQKV